MVASTTLRTVALAGLMSLIGAQASVYLPPPQTEFEAAVQDATKPILDWNNDLCEY
jgi:hypothetical protein